MRKIAAAEVQKNFGQFREKAIREGVVVTAHGKPSVVIIGYAEYERLKELDRRILRFEDMTDAQLREMADAKIPKKYRYRMADIPDVD